MKKFLSSRIGLVVLIIGGMIIIFTFQSVGAIKPIEDGLNFVFNPVQGFFNKSATKIKNFFVYFNDFKDLKDTNNKIENENVDLIAENFILKRQLEDYQEINELNKFISEHNYKSISSKIIGKSSDEYQQVIIINSGTSDGVVDGYPVIAKKGFLIGKVIDANKHTAKVLLLIDNHSSISSTVQNSTKSQGITNGQHGITLKMELIPQEHTVELDQLVTTSGLEQYIPPDLIIGKIVEQIKIDGELFQEAIIEPIINYQNLSVVNIILPVND